MGPPAYGKKTGQHLPPLKKPFSNNIDSTFIEGKAVFMLHSAKILAWVSLLKTVLTAAY